MRKVPEFHANGKLLITGEYLVLVGATALALPVRFGQKLQAEESGSNLVEWESASPSGVWFKGTFDPETFRIVSIDKMELAGKLRELLLAARTLNPGFLKGQGGFSVRTHADYPPEWGLGSSSTLCWLVAAWAGVNPYDLHGLVSNGSGYDIACAGRSEILYFRRRDGKPEVTSASAGRALREYTYFVYLGKKQDSTREVHHFLANLNPTEKEVEQVSSLASRICLTDSFDELYCLIEEHESLISTVLKREPIARRFPSFPGTAKSLGAWGGDFAMFASGNERGEVLDILRDMGFPVVFTYNEIKAAS